MARGYEILHELTKGSKVLARLSPGDQHMLLDWMSNAIDGNVKMGGAKVTNVVHMLAQRHKIISGTDYLPDDEIENEE